VSSLIGYSPASTETAVMMTDTLTVPIWLLALLVVALIGGAMLLLGHRRRPLSKSTNDRGVRSGYVPASLVTVEDIRHATGISRRTVLLWTNAELLPQPRHLPLGDQGRALFYPPGTLDRARFIVSKRAAGLTLEQIRKMIDDDREPPPEGGASVGVVLSA